MDCMYERRTPVTFCYVTFLAESEEGSRTPGRGARVKRGPRI